MYIIILVSVIVIFDQIVKYFIQKKMFLNESIPVITGILNITYIRNKGAAFGILSDMPNWFRIPFFITSGIVFIVFVFMYFKTLLKQNLIIRTGISMVVGGALGNFVDRIRFGEVIDFIEVGINDRYKWPIFNVADSCISVGVTLLLFYIICVKEKK